MQTKTQQILKLTASESFKTNVSAPYNNQYQGNERRLLFVCSVGLLRSPTAADIATKLGYNARSCGSSKEALMPLSVNLIAWADSIYFMNHDNYTQALWVFEDSQRYDTLVSKSVVWDIEDDYERNDPWLIKLIGDRLTGLRNE